MRVDRSASQRMVQPVLLIQRSAPSVARWMRSISSKCGGTAPVATPCSITRSRSRSSGWTRESASSTVGSASGDTPSIVRSSADQLRLPVAVSKSQMPSRADWTASRNRSSLSASSRSVSWRSWTSSSVPYQRTTRPSSSRRGAARARIQRYSPLRKRMRYWMSRGAPLDRQSAHSAITRGASSGWTACTQPAPSTSSYRSPVSAVKSGPACSIRPSGDAVQGTCGLRATDQR